MPKYNPIPENGPRLVVSNKFPDLHYQILDAIKMRRQVSFIYQGKLRIVEPHDYGVQNGSARLLSYQTGGQSGSGRLPNWRIFEVNKIFDFIMLEKTFPGNRPAQQHYQWDTLYARVGEPK